VGRTGDRFGAPLFEIAKAAEPYAAMLTTPDCPMEPDPGPTIPRACANASNGLDVRA